MNKIFYEPKSTNREAVCLYGEFLTTTNGTLSTAANAVYGEGFSIVKTAGKVGRYTITYSNAERLARVLGVTATIVGPADAAYTASKGLVSFIRNLTATGFDLQFCLAADASRADAELADGARVLLVINGSNVPVAS
jgi:hypothetical protein